ncbi:PREDICTED: alpha-protein kinase 2-like, partial [Eurypyga helias]|uniref:alpha-protein kinase 2-like n=1 Tax=Eurypyga helias TaxID=54383 RepID=UPI0005292AAB
TDSSQVSGLLREKLRKAGVLSPFEKPHRSLPNTEDNMNVQNVFKTQGGISCLRDLSGNGGDLLHFNRMVNVGAVKAEKYCSSRVCSCPARALTGHTDNRFLDMEDAVSGQPLADVQDCEKTGLSTSLTTNTLLGEQGGTPVVNHNYFIKGDAEISATVLEINAEMIPSVSDDFYDHSLEYFECSDVLTEHENEIWKEKLQFLLESDDEDNLKLSKDCDGCAYFLSEMPCLFQVSDNTTPMDTTIGFCGHHSKFKGVNVRRDPSMYSQSPLQTEMTLTVGHHRDKSPPSKDKEKGTAPVTSAAAENEHPKTAEENNGSGHSAASFSADTSKNQDNICARADSSTSGRGAALANQPSEMMAETGMDKDLLGEGSLLLEEEGRNFPEENAKHAVCTLTESLRRNLLKLLNPKELCRYVSNIGQSFQTAAEARECSALLPSRESVHSEIPKETESSQMQGALCPTEEADNDCCWEGKRTWGLPEQNQTPDENVSPRNQDPNLKIFTQNCERLCTEPDIGKELVRVTCETGGAIHPASETLCTEKTLQAKNAKVQTYSQHRAACEQSASSHQQVCWEQGFHVISNGHKSERDVSPFPLGDVDSAVDKQECVCAALSSAKLCDEPGEGEQRCSFDSHGSSDTDTLHSLSCADSLSEANPKSVMESGEPECKGDAGISAVHDKLWKLLHEDDSDDQIPCETRGITSLEIGPTDTKVTELNFVQETCSGHPLPVHLMEELEPETQPTRAQRTEEEDCSASNILLKTDEACKSVSTENICLAQVVETDGVCLDSSTRNKMETPPICVSADSVILSTGECLEQDPNATLTGSDASIQVAVAWEGKLAFNNTSQTSDADAPQRLRNAQSGHLACDKESPAYLSAKSHVTFGRLLHTAHHVPLIDGSVTGNGRYLRDAYPARKGLACFPEEKDILPSENTLQFTHGEHFSVNTIHKSYEGNLQEKGNHSDLSAPNDTNSDSYSLSKNDDCQEFQVVCDALKCSSQIQSPDLIKASETVTCKSLPRNAGQLTEMENQEVAFIPSSEDTLLRDLYVEMPRYKRCKSGEQRVSCIGDEQRADTSCESGVSHGSGSEAALSPHHASEHACFTDSPFNSGEDLKADSSKKHTYASGSVTSPSSLLPRKAENESHIMAREGCGGRGHRLGIQELDGKEPVPFITPVSQAEQLLTHVSAVGCPGTGGDGKMQSTQTSVRAGENESRVGTSCKALQDQCHRGLGENEEEAVVCENKRAMQRTVECNLGEAEAKSPSHTSVGCEARGRAVNTGTKQPAPGLVSASKLPEVDHPIMSTAYDNDEVMTSESARSRLVNLPPVDSGNNQYFQEKPPCSRTQPFSLALATREPFPITADRPSSQEGSESTQTSPVAEPEPIRCKQHTAKSGQIAAGAKKKLPPAMLSKKPRLEESSDAGRDPSCSNTAVKGEVGMTHKEDRKEQRKLILKKDSK